MRIPSIRRLVRLPGTTLLGAFLVATVVLSGWLTYQALDAARSHRQIVEAALRDHAGISAWELSRRARKNLDEVLDEAFDPVYRRLRGDDLPGARVVEWGLDDAARDQRCRCPDLQRAEGFFRVVLPDFDLTSHPADLPAPALRRVAREILADVQGSTRREEGLLVVSGVGLESDPAVVGYSLARSESEAGGVLYAFVVRPEAMSQLFDSWYGSAQLLPRPIAGDQPNDSLLTASVRSSGGVELFRSPVPYEETFVAADTLAAELGGLVVQAAIRPDAASQLIIGGLPRSRLPLLMILLILTLGVGAAALLQTRRERELALLRDDFVSGVSHELRTPLAQIRMFAELQAAGVLSSDEDRARAARVIHREARRLSHLVENILQYSKLRRAPGDGPLTEAVVVEAVVEESVEAVQTLADSRRAEVRVEQDDGALALANRAALSQILVNLLDNALKYGPLEQVVTVRVEEGPHVVRFVVDDQGPGIPPGDRERIWEPYRRLSRDVRSGQPGTGIGLAVVARLASVHGGRAWIEDAPGGGARVVVELRRAVRSRNADAPSSPSEREPRASPVVASRGAEEGGP